MAEDDEPGLVMYDNDGVQEIVVAAVAIKAVKARRHKDGWRFVESDPAGSGKTRLTFARGPEVLAERVLRELREREAELLPCPFCGVGNPFSRGEYVVCRGCGTEGPSGESQQHGMMLWDQRKP